MANRTPHIPERPQPAGYGEYPRTLAPETDRERGLSARLNDRPWTRGFVKPDGTRVRLFIRPTSLL